MALFTYIILKRFRFYDHHSSKLIFFSEQSFWQLNEGLIIEVWPFLYLIYFTIAMRRLKMSFFFAMAVWNSSKFIYCCQSPLSTLLDARCSVLKRCKLRLPCQESRPISQKQKWCKQIGLVLVLKLAAGSWQLLKTMAKAVARHQLNVSRHFNIHKHKLINDKFLEKNSHKTFLNNLPWPFVCAAFLYDSMEPLNINGFFS